MEGKEMIGVLSRSLLAVVEVTDITPETLRNSIANPHNGRLDPGYYIFTKGICFRLYTTGGFPFLQSDECPRVVLSANPDGGKQYRVWVFQSGGNRYRNYFDLQVALQVAADEVLSMKH